MAGKDRQHWDMIYHERAHQPYPPPDPLMLQFTPPAPNPYAPSVSSKTVSRALDLAGGLGQNALWLAGQGYMVDLIDISRAALTRAQEEAARRARAPITDDEVGADTLPRAAQPDLVRGINFIQADLDHATLEREMYDVVCVFRFLDRALFPALRAAVRPGGRIVYETYNTRHTLTQPNFNPDYLLNVGELAGVFADWRALHGCEPPDDNTAQVVALKP
ncbi:MAG: class I SAM-dependent methyltransferase [Chloroflexota bacterium]|nr:class I SAM-dependent methyltransferase [Chloroflexota bacterium]